MKNVSHIILGALLATGTVMAAEGEVDFDRYDADRDGYLSEREWQDVDFIIVDFANIDSNRDGRLDRNEVNRATDGGSMRSQQASRSGAAGESGQSGEPQQQRSGQSGSQSAGQSSGQSGTESGGSGEQFDARQMSEEFGARSTTVASQGTSQGQGNSEGMQAFKDTDKDRDNRVSRQEAEDAGFDYIVMFFDPLDANRDGYLDENEWNLDGSAGASSVDMRTGAGSEGGRNFEDSAGDAGYDLEDNFENWDINADGYLDRNEAAESNVNWIDFHFDETDANDDGLLDIGEANDGFMEWGDDEPGEFEKF